MPLFLQVTLVVALVVVCGFLVALLIQMKRTATAVQALAESARTDLNVIAADIHHLRNRADELADLAAQGMALPATLTGLVSGFQRSMEGFLGRGSSPLIDLLLSGSRLAMDWFVRRKPAAPQAPAQPEPAPM